MSAGAPVPRSGPSRTVQQGRDECGSGSMLMIGVCVVVMMLGYTAMVFCGYLIAGHRARAAADLAALSGATAAGQGGDPCASARHNARAHRAHLSSCERVGDQIDYVVTVTATVSTLVRTPGLPRQVSATAHAGSEEVRR
ncbi:MAG TPA: Rv3654c family TadE-like protein [Microlunatus sp.]|nr:Rv3654c family TadE-like protein [Microlunatus sp.]